MIKKILLLILIIINVFTLSSCWSKKEPKDLAIGTCFIYDIDDNERIKLIAEIYDPNIGSAEDSVMKKSYLLELEGQTVPEALRNTTKTVAHLLYGAHNRARIFTEKAAKDKMVDLLDYYVRGQLTNELPYLLVLKDEEDPLKVFEAQIGLYKLLGSYIDAIAEARMKTSIDAVFTTTLDFVRCHYCEGKQPVMSVIQIVENPASLPYEEEENTPSGPPTQYNLVFEGLAVFKDGKFLGYLDKNGAKAYNYLNNNVVSPYSSFALGEDDLMAIAINKSSTKIETSSQIAEGKVKIEVNIKDEFSVVHNQTQYNTTKTKDVKLIEQAYNQSLQKDILEAITLVQQEYASDIFGFGRAFHRQNPKVWQQIKAEWDDVYFANAEVVVNVEGRLYVGGQTRERFGERVINE